MNTEEGEEILGRETKKANLRGEIVGWDGMGGNRIEGNRMGGKGKKHRQV